MTPIEVEALAQAISLLEPEVQKGVSAFVKVLRGKKKLTAADYLHEAQKLLDVDPLHPIT